MPMRTFVIALTTIAVLTAPAYARGKGSRQASGQQTEEQKKKAAEAEQAYKAALGKIPDQKKADPWGSMR
jgi:hypothetical protein